MKVHVIVTCSKRKRGTERVRLSDVTASSTQERVERWVHALSDASGSEVTARDLYQGEKWTHLRELEVQGLDGADLDFWILSAGYGLVPFDASLVPYSATFGQDDPDSVIGEAFDHTPERVLTDWWWALSTWEGPSHDPRSISDLVRRDRDCSLMIAASPVYLKAIGEDVASAEEEMAVPERLMIFSGGANPNGDGSRIMAFDGRLRRRFGGSLMSLNVRVMSAVLHTVADLARSSAQETIDKWMTATPQLARIQRQPTSNRAIRNFIRTALIEDPDLGWTPLLRKLRADGWACEQKRFRSIHSEVRTAVQRELQFDLSEPK